MSELNALHIILISLGAGLAEFVISFFFNYKIFLITKERFVLAGFYGAISTLIYMIMSGFVIYFSSVTQDPLILVFSALMIALGNFCSTIVIKKWHDWRNEVKLKKTKNSKEQIEQIKSIYEIDFNLISSDSFIHYLDNSASINENDLEKEKLLETENNEIFIVEDFFK